MTTVIEAFPNYEINEDLRVFNRVSGKEVKPYKTNNYYQIALYRGGKKHQPCFHRVVAEAFLPNPEYLPVVNHIDGDTTNNHVSNLEWCTQQENVEKAIAMKWVMKSPDGELVEFTNMAKFCREHGLSRSNLHKVAIGKRKQHRGWTVL